MSKIECSSMCKCHIDFRTDSHEKRDNRIKEAVLHFLSASGVDRFCGDGQTPK